MNGLGAHNKINIIVRMNKRKVRYSGFSKKGERPSINRVEVCLELQRGQVS